MTTPEELGLSFAQGMGQSVGETAGSRFIERGKEKDRRRRDEYDRKMRALGDGSAAIKEATDRFNSAIRAGRTSYARWCKRDTRESFVDNDPFVQPEELDAEDWAIQHARAQHQRFRDAVTELDEALDALVPWYAALPEWTVDQDPTRAQLTTLIRDLEDAREAWCARQRAEST
jgi:hypothetical protein